MKLLLARPTYGPIEPLPANHLLAAVMYAGNHGTEWVGPLCPDRVVHAAARNLSAVGALDTEAEAIMWVDSDVLIPTEAITRLAGYLERSENPLDFVSGVYFQRRPPHWPLVASFNKETRVFHWASQFTANCIAPVDGVGFGCCITTTKLIRKIMELDECKAQRDKGPFEYAKYSEDLTFCLRAAQVGVQPYVDTGILCGHLSDPELITVNQFDKVQKQMAWANEDLKAATEGETMRVRLQ